MTLTDGQLEEKIRVTKVAYQNIFGYEPTKGEMLEVLNEAIEKRKRAVLTDRLTTQRGDKDLLKLRELLSPTPKRAAGSSQKKADAEE